MRRLTLVPLTLLVLLATPLPAFAVAITAVTAPNLLRPRDGAVYLFNITVTGTFDGFDIMFGGGYTFGAQYWDADVFADDPIDLTGSLVVPPPLGSDVAGSTWGPVSVDFEVGCTVGGIVFGPSGSTGEGPVMDDGYFYFLLPLGAVSWGYNTVTCVAPSLTPLPNPPPTPFNPTQPFPSLSEVPEPSTLMLLGPVVGLLAVLRRRRKH